MLHSLLKTSSNDSSNLSKVFEYFQFTVLSGYLRLRGPFEISGTGRVEIFHNGQWGTICDNDWDIRDARVVCRQLGYADAVSSLHGYQVSSGSGPIWLSNVACTGTEQNITGCFHARWGENNCRHSEDAGVECTTTGKCFLKGMRNLLAHNMLSVPLQWVGTISWGNHFGTVEMFRKIIHQDN